MSDSETPTGAADGYSVGYGRPPLNTRFQPGKSGNPRGRPKAQKSLGQVLEEALSRRIAVNENGRQRTMRMRDVIVQGLVNDAAKRDARALRLLFSLMDRYSGDQEGAADTLLPDDRAILEAYLQASTAQPEPTMPREGAAPVEASASHGDPGDGDGQ